MADETQEEETAPEEERNDETSDENDADSAQEKIDDATANNDNAPAGEKEGETAEAEEPTPPEPDDPSAVEALQEVGARLETNEAGNVWRVFFYERHTDADVTKMHSLHSLKQVWVVGSKATPECVEQLRGQFPDATVFA